MAENLMGGRCGVGYPNAEDHCSAECGVVFEPFCAPAPLPALCAIALTGATPARPGDQCGDMLTSAGMGGMDEMSIFCAPTPPLPQTPTPERSPRRLAAR